MKASDRNINFLYLNVCGLKPKLNIPEFNELIQTYDIAMSFTMFWNVVSLTLIEKSFYHTLKGNLLTALPMQIYLMLLTLGD